MLDKNIITRALRNSIVMPIGILFPALIVSNLSIEHSAAWFICVSICGIFSIFDFGISNLIIKKVSETPNLINTKYFSRFLIAYSITILAIFVLIPFQYRDLILTWYKLDIEYQVIFTLSCFIGYSALLAIQRVIDSCIIALKFGYVVSNLEITVASLRLLLLGIILINYEITLISLVGVYVAPSAISFLISFYYFCRFKKEISEPYKYKKFIKMQDVRFSVKSWMISLSAYGNRSGFFLLTSIFLTNEDQVMLGIIMLILTTAMQIISTSLSVIPPYVSAIIAEFNVNEQFKFMRFISYNQVLNSVTMTGYLLVGVEALNLVLRQPMEKASYIFLIASPMVISYAFYSTSNIARTILVYGDESTYVFKVEVISIILYLSTLAILLIFFNGNLLLVSIVTSIYYLLKYYLGVWKRFEDKYLFRVTVDHMKFFIFCLLAAISCILPYEHVYLFFLKSIILITGSVYIWKEVKRLKYGYLS